MGGGGRIPGKASRDFQIFAKPAGAVCNLDCQYCYYRDKSSLYPETGAPRMPDSLLEEYIVQHLEAAGGPEVSFSWHGGEPTTLGVDFFRKAVELQRKHKPAGWRIRNGIQTNGVLLDEEWGRFLAAEAFSIGLSLDGPAELHDAYRVTKGGQPTHRQVMRGYEILRKHGVFTSIVCVVHNLNVRHPLTVYRFFRQTGCRHLGFLPAVTRAPESATGVDQYHAVRGGLRGVSLQDLRRMDRTGRRPDFGSDLRGSRQTGPRHGALLVRVPRNLRPDSGSGTQRRLLPVRPFRGPRTSPGEHPRDAVSRTA